MSSTLRWDGMAEFRAALAALPDTLVGEARGIVDTRAEHAAALIRPAYPVHTGNLRDHVRVTHAEAGKLGAAAVVANTAKHAHLFEDGTEARHTDLGANRGSMPPGHVFVPIIIRERRAMYDDLRAMLEREGLLVTGSEDD